MSASFLLAPGVLTYAIMKYTLQTKKTTILYLLTCAHPSSYTTFDLHITFSYTINYKLFHLISIRFVGVEFGEGVGGCRILTFNFDRI